MTILNKGKTMITKHSKGEWKAEIDECHYDSVSDVYAGDYFIASVCGETIEEMEANTILVASAPEMLECIRNCCITLASIGVTMEADIMKDIVKVVRMAIGEETK